MATKFIRRWNITRENPCTGKLQIMHLSSDNKVNAFDVMAILQAKFPHNHYIMIDAWTNIQYDVTIVSKKDRKTKHSPLNFAI